MTTALFTHPSSLLHDPGPGHPERIERMIAIQNALAAPEFDKLIRREAPQATREQLMLAHPENYIDNLKKIMPDDGYRDLEPSTTVNKGSYMAALHSAGAVCAAVDGVLAGEFTHAACILRPPGHHAERHTTMGFCLFSNIAIGTLWAIEKHNLKRVAIIDYDVHHGNGTQDILWDNNKIFFASSHESPLYPGTGMRDETGAHGQIMNCPLPSYSGSHEFRAVYENEVLPRLDAYNPELILVSAGYDADARDPLSTMQLHTDDFGWISGQLAQAAQKHCKGKIISTLEGGYHLDALAEGVAAHLRALL